jgi:hypothetical protein
VGDMKIPTIVVLGIALLAVPPAQAQRNPEHGARAGFLVQTDMEFGGDTVATVNFEDGDTQDVHAGQGLSFGIGAYLRPSEKVPVEIAGIVGYKFVTTAASNADINLSRTVWKLNATWWFEKGWFVTAGLTHHSSPTLDGDDFFEDVSFDDATGISAEVGWRWIALRYTNIDYSLPGFEDTDASSIGLGFTWRFGGRRGGY